MIYEIIKEFTRWNTMANKKAKTTKYKPYKGYTTYKPIVPAIDRVKNPVDGFMKQLELRCRMAESEFFTLPNAKLVETSNGRWYVYIDNGASILGVAHLDTVLPHPDVCEYDGQTLFSPCLDDRIGVFTLLDVLPLLNCEFDILLTTDEEIGGSTAKFFETDKDYNWVFEFDRTGTDVVMYKYEDTDSRKMLEDIGCKVGHGSFTDICELGNLGAKAFNFGTGYHSAHTTHCHVVRSEYEKMVGLFVKFYDEYCDVKLLHTKDMEPAPTYTRYGGSYSNFNGYTDNYAFNSNVAKRHGKSGIHCVICENKMTALELEECLDVDVCQPCWNAYMRCLDCDSSLTYGMDVTACPTCNGVDVGVFEYEDYTGFEYCLGCEAVLQDNEDRLCFYCIDYDRFLQDDKQ